MLESVEEGHWVRRRYGSGGVIELPDGAAIHRVLLYAEGIREPVFVEALAVDDRWVRLSDAELDLFYEWIDQRSRLPRDLDEAS